MNKINFLLFRSARMWLTSLLCIGCLRAICSNALAASQPVQVGNARFTVITANLIRLEYQPSCRFVDLPSTFAATRSNPKPVPYTVTRSDGATCIRTGPIILTYSPDGEPFDATNLSITVNVAGSIARWVPGTNDLSNLGGTAKTLDQVAGPINVGQGVLSRSGWALIDDSESDLLTPDGWVEERPDAQKAGEDWYFFGYGNDYRAALSSLTAVSGAVPLPRRYALGVWYSRYWPWSEDDYRNIVTKYGTENFPLDNVVLDMDWHKDGWTGWSWNTKLLPDAPGLLAWFHSQGLHDTVNLHPAEGVAPYEDSYAPFMKNLGLDPGSGVTVPFDAGSRTYMNDLFSTILDPLKSNGVDFWWLDWQQYPYSRSVPDLTNLFWLNTLLYNYTSEGGQRGMSFSRWGGWGDQRHPIHFSGDANTGFPMLAYEIPFTSTAGNVGCFFWSNDIGGHMGGRNEESYARWCQFGATSPVLRSHSTRDPQTDRAPWNYPKWAEDSMRISFHLRSQLFPYIYSSAEESCAESIPLDRPVYLDLPTVDEAFHNGQEFFLGDNILVAPVAMAGAGPGHVSWQSVWFPPTESGFWYNLQTGERGTANSTALAAADMNEFPIYVRGGVPLLMQPYTPRMGTTQVQTLRIRCYPGNDGQLSSSTLYEDDGITTGYLSGQSATTKVYCKRHGQWVKIVIDSTLGTFVGQPTSRAYIVELPDIAKPQAVRVDGAKMSVRYDQRHYAATVAIRQLPRNRTVTILVGGYKPTGWDQLHSVASTRRMGESLGVNVSSAVLTRTLVAEIAAAPQDEQQSALASVGIGLDRKNVATNFFPEAYQNQIFVPYGLTDGNRVVLSDGSVLMVPHGGLAGAPLVPVSGLRPSFKFGIGKQSFEILSPTPGILTFNKIPLGFVASAISVQPGTQNPMSKSRK